MTVSDKHEIAFAFRSTTPIAQCLRLCALRSLSDLTELLVALTEDCDCYQVYDSSLISKILGTIIQSNIFQFIEGVKLEAKANDEVSNSVARSNPT